MSKPIRILHVFGRLDLGGAESRTMDIYRRIDRSKIQFDFIIHTEDKCFFSKEIEELGGKIYSIPRFNGKNYISYKKAWKFFFENNQEYKVIHGHQTSTAYIYLSIAREFKIPVRIAHSRNSNKDTIIKQYTSKLSRFPANQLLAVSKEAGISEFGRKLVNNNSVKIVPNAIDVKKYLYDSQIRNVKRKELLIEDDIVIGHIGRFHKQKNHHFLIEIFKEIIHINKNVKLVLIGEGHLRKEIEYLTTEKGIEDQVLFLGKRDDVPDILQAIDVLLFPSFYEGFPGVVLEAQAAGLPSVISDTITKEIKITDLVEYLSLENDAINWANLTLDIVNRIERRDTYKEISESGYDIVEISKWYEEFYIENITRSIL